MVSYAMLTTVTDLRHHGGIEVSSDVVEPVEEHDNSAAAKRLRHIANAAMHCFNRQGIAGTTMEDIAAEAGIARPNLYRYVRTREDLIRIVVLERSRHFIQRKYASGRNWRETLAHFIAHIVTSSRNDPIISLVHEQASFDAASLVESDYAMNHALYRIVAPLLHEGRAAGELRTDLSEDEILKWLNFQAMSFVRARVYLNAEELDHTIETMVVRAITVDKA